MKSLTLALLPALAAPFLAQSTKLNSPLAIGAAGGDARGIAASPDGRWILYVADQDRAGAVNAYCVPADGSAPPLRLSQAHALMSLYDTNDVSRVECNSQSTAVALFRNTGQGTELALAALPRLGDHGKARHENPNEVELSTEATTHATARFAPDGRSIAYVSSTSTPFRAELRIARTSGQRRSLFLDRADYFISPPKFSPDGRWLVYERSSCWDCASELVSIDLAGSRTPTVLASPTPGWRFEVSANSARVVFSNGAGVFSVPIDGSAQPLPIGPTLDADEIVWDLRTASFGRAILCTARENHDTFSEFRPYRLFSLKLDGSAPAVQLNPTLPVGRELGTRPFEITPDGTRVIYWANPNGNLAFELFWVPITGGTAVRLGASGNVVDFRVCPNSTGVVLKRAGRLYAARFVGGETQLTGQLVGGGEVTQFEISPDGDHVVYRADGETNEVFELWRVAMTGGSSTKLNASLPTGGDVSIQWLITADSARVAYIANQDTASELEVYAVPILGGTPHQLSGPLDPGPPQGNVYSEELTPDGTRVVYWADGDTDEITELYSVPVTGGPTVKLDGPLVPNGKVNGPWSIAANGRVVFVATKENAQRLELFSAPADGSAPAVKLNHPLPTAGFMQGVTDFTLSASGEFVVYRSPSGTGLVSLHVTRTDGTGTPVPLSLPGQVTSFVAPTGNTRVEFRISGDETRLVYRAGPDLYMVPLSGLVPPLRLNPAFSPGSVGVPYAFGVPLGIETTFYLAGDRVLYSADTSGTGVYELWSVPIDGSAAAVRVSAALAGQSDVVQFAPSPDGERTLYYAGSQADFSYELFSAPVDASAPPVLLSDPNTPLDFDVPSQIQYSPDGQGVLFTDHQSLYLAPVDGSAPGVLLVTDGLNASSFFARGESVLYVTRQGLLRSVPLDQSTPPVTLNNPLMIGNQMASYLTGWDISPDGRLALFAADERVDGRTELFACPIDGSSPALVLTSPMTHAGGIRTEDHRGRLLTSSTHVVYRSSHERAGVVELYSSLLP